MDPRVIATAAKVGNVIESLLATVRRGRAGPTEKQIRIIPHRSLGDPARLTVRGRVVRQATTSARPLGRHGAVTTREHLAALYRAFDAEELSYATVEASLDGVAARTACDAGGFFAIDLPAPNGRPWRAGCLRPQTRLLDVGPTFSASAATDALDQRALVEVFVAGAEARLAIVSDLDDTAMDTNTPNTVAAISTITLRSARRRRPVPGVVELYTGLRDGSHGDAQNPVCYISSGAWNLYDIVLDYLDTHGLPPGAMMLNDWGSPERAFHTVEHSHKSVQVNALMSRLPHLPFLLVGDDVQEDAELYADIALRHPGRVPAIWIRAVRGRASRLRDIASLQTSLTTVGTRLVVAADTERFVEDATARDWLPRRTPNAGIRAVPL